MASSAISVSSSLSSCSADRVKSICRLKRVFSNCFCIPTLFITGAEWIRTTKTKSSVIFAGGQSHCLLGIGCANFSQGFQPNILRANTNSFSACTINSSTWPQPMAFSKALMSLFFK
ncbi:hypothetical protein FF38_06241 [Lucilia cuprina]|uniref:Uncharacterized protein n=1 Tax=Lucilia cuprina TaxID=7375 RepID=A0A0L0CP52_LUCCU|nr:hypothetical protein FF38_06241 [Lucilia cuprina]